MQRISTLNSVKKLLYIAVLLAVCTQTVSCFRGSVTGDATKENILKVGQTVQIVLGENQTTPYRWYYRVSDYKAIHLQDDYYRSDSNLRGLSGIGGTHYFYFVANKPGEYAIKFQNNPIGKGYQTGESDLEYRLRIIN